MTHNIIDDIVLINIFGMFDRIIFKAYLTTILQKARNITGFIFQMNSIYVPTENDFPELVECISHMKGIKKVAIIVSNNLQVTIAETSLTNIPSNDIGVKICSDGHSAIDWAVH